MCSSDVMVSSNVFFSYGFLLYKFVIKFVLLLTIKILIPSGSCIIFIKYFAKYFPVRMIKEKVYSIKLTSKSAISIV